MKPRPHPIGPNQESVWHYPRPAVAVPTSARIVIQHRNVVVADTTRAVRTLETSHPPSYYIPPADIAPGLLRRAGGGSLCEWKGAAIYWDVVVEGEVLPHVGWSYPSPTPAFTSLRNYVAFYAGPFDRCSVGGETATPQPGSFYGGWITADVAGPFKGCTRQHGLVTAHATILLFISMRKPGDTRVDYHCRDLAGSGRSAYWAT